MLTKQFGALHLFVLAALLTATIVIGLGVIYFLDRALIERTLSRHNATGSNPVAQSPSALAADESTPKPTVGAAQAGTDETKEPSSPTTTNVPITDNTNTPAALAD